MYTENSNGHISLGHNNRDVNNGDEAQCQTITGSMDEPLLEKQFSYFKRSYVQFKKEKTYLIIYVFKQTNYQNVKKIN